MCFVYSKVNSVCLIGTIIELISFLIRDFGEITDELVLHVSRSKVEHNFVVLDILSMPLHSN